MNSVWPPTLIAAKLLFAAVLFNVGWVVTAGAAEPVAARVDSTSTFLSRHWSYPIAPQGNPPAGFSPLEASLDPGACGQCHVQQFLDWKASLHSRTMGPGIRWQFFVMGQKAANECMRCHAPLAEQKALLAMDRGWEHAPSTPPPRYVAPDLHLQGLVCAACHVRRHERFGPPPRGGAGRARDPAMPHGGFSAQPAFEDSRFCAACHQFPASGPSLNGKLLENTFEEWRASAAAKRGRTCQSCHMPDRRHLWRGIHDPDMVRKALHVSLEVRRRGKGAMWAQAQLTNVGAGHHFPTYVVPEVVASLELLDAQGKVRSQIARKVIGREVNLGLTQEISDTRIPAGGRVLFGGGFPAPRSRGWTVELRIVVDPGKHYARVFRSVLEHRERIAPGGNRLLDAALAQVSGPGYEAFRIRRPVPPS
jgi:hypothetical protein